jgi:NADH-quinone oxidoreductase subunit L
MTTRIGDVIMLVGMMLLYMWSDPAPWSSSRCCRWRTWSTWPRMTCTIPLIGVTTPAVALIAVLIFFGTVGKSAQFPLHVWLPDAMEGPTPVSALIHAATMVSAGVFLVVRMFPLFFVAGETAPGSMQFVAMTGAFTALFRLLIAVAQWDIKRVLAYSTIAQLGFMIAALGTGAYVAGLFHLITHAFFKALLFLGSGSVIHGVEHGFHMPTPTATATAMATAHDATTTTTARTSSTGARTATWTRTTRRTCATWAACSSGCRSPAGRSSSAAGAGRLPLPLRRFLVEG